MIVDDDEIDGFVTKRLIEDNHFAEKLIAFMNAKDALEYLKANENNPDELPSIIFLDIIMPVMDGFGFLEEFDKMSDVIRKKSKIILLSTSKFLTKPLLKEALEAINF